MTNKICVEAEEEKKRRNYLFIINNKILLQLVYAESTWQNRIMDIDRVYSTLMHGHLILIAILCELEQTVRMNNVAYLSQRFNSQDKKEEKTRTKTKRRINKWMHRKIEGNNEWDMYSSSLWPMAIGGSESLLIVLSAIFIEKIHV